MKLMETISTNLDGSWKSKLNLEAKSRAAHLMEILKLLSTIMSNPSPAPPPICLQLYDLFTIYELNPIAVTAQGKVPVPESLDLDICIGNPIPDTTSILFPPTPPPEPVGKHASSKSKTRQKDFSSISSHGNAAHFAGRDSRFYLKDSASRHPNTMTSPDVNEIPIVKLQLDDYDDHLGTTRSKSRKKGSKKHSSTQRRHRRQRRESSPSPPPGPQVEIAQDEDVLPTNKGSSGDNTDGQVQVSQAPDSSTRYAKNNGKANSKDVLENPDLGRLAKLQLGVNLHSKLNKNEEMDESQNPLTGKTISEETSADKVTSNEAQNPGDQDSSNNNNNIDDVCIDKEQKKTPKPKRKTKKSKKGK
ncbi:AP-3 complex subunit delta [Mycoemilia scoparia]|uniref:AP-3 complex subunit delta n=1 Tax=Mycoemilia scoparia TaxID=417184 RepID=A0A9W8A676_9FUNG|nr:AP-3 complex subunit delta [Mycoemilia scoparia]